MPKTGQVTMPAAVMPIPVLLFVNIPRHMLAVQKSVVLKITIAMRTILKDVVCQLKATIAVRPVVGVNQWQSVLKTKNGSRSIAIPGTRSNVVNQWEQRIVQNQKTDIANPALSARMTHLLVATRKRRVLAATAVAAKQRNARHVDVLARVRNAAFMEEFAHPVPSADGTENARLMAHYGVAGTIAILAIPARQALFAAVQTIVQLIAENTAVRLVIYACLAAVVVSQMVQSVAVMVVFVHQALSAVLTELARLMNHLGAAVITVCQLKFVQVDLRGVVRLADHKHADQSVVCLVIVKIV